MHGLCEAERRSLSEDGFVLRKGVFETRELEPVADACERLVAGLAQGDRGSKFRMESYVFELLPASRTVLKWERGAEATVLGVEPIAHLDPVILKHAMDPRFVDPMRDILAVDTVTLYTEKLNCKRARVGGPIVLHQDYPYWADVADDANQIATAVLFLDAADTESGCLEVVAGSHRHGVAAGLDVKGFGQNEIDPARFDADAFTALQVPAGRVAFFGPLLIHRSGPNRSTEDRRALLFSYQPEGFKHSREYVAIKGKNPTQDAR